MYIGDPFDKAELLSSSEAITSVTVRAINCKGQRVEKVVFFR